jgi:small subunit ribosomal protein S3
MIERKFVEEKLKEFQIQEYVDENMKGVGQSHIKVQRTPLGEKIIVFASKPGLVVGRGGENIKKLTKTLKKKFGLENPQIEISEVENINLDANIVAEMIANSLERFGSSKFKGVGHKTMENVMNGGALGVEILISGKIPGSRAKRWRFYQGYLKKCGDVALIGIRTSYKTANLKTGVIGIQVRIMPPDIELADNIKFKSEDFAKAPAVEEVKEEEKVEVKNKSKKKDVKEKKKPVKKSLESKKDLKKENKIETTENKVEEIKEEVKEKE